MRYIRDRVYGDILSTVCANIRCEVARNVERNICEDVAFNVYDNVRDGGLAYYSI